jgi:hypothetical protein
MWSFRVRGLVMGCWLVTAGATTAWSQTGCVPAAIPRYVSQLRLQQEALQKQKVNEMETLVPAAIRNQIVQLKDALADALDMAMRCAPAEVDATALEADLAKTLGANQPEKPAEPKPEEEEETPGIRAYGGDLKVSATAPPNAPQWRIVTVSFGIECGEDTMLLLYEWAGWGWRRSLRWQSAPYVEISGAFGSFFQYAVVPGAVPQKIVVAHGTPACKPSFSTFKIDVLEKIAGGNSAGVWLHMERGYSPGDGEIRLRGSADTFTLRVNAPALDANADGRLVIYRYAIDGRRLSRIAPISTTGRGFVEEWLEMPWDEAIGQTAPEAVGKMQRVHSGLARLDRDATTSVNYTYGPVRACTVKGKYEVEMDADRGGPEFFTIKDQPVGYLMVDYGTTHDEHCNGPDLTKTQ